MMKIQRISNFQTFFPNFLARQLDKQHQAFLHNDLGKIYQAIPWKKLVKHFKLKDNPKGPTSTFPPQGKIALMFLKAYSQTSDRKLIAQLNGNIYYQYFCGIRLEIGQQLTNHKIISQIRCELAQKLKIQPLQSILARHWTPHMRQLSKVVIDATRYESALRYPTIQKLLWESVHFLYKTLKKTCRKLDIKLPRTKYKKWNSAIAPTVANAENPKKKK